MKINLKDFGIFEYKTIKNGNTFYKQTIDIHLNNGLIIEKVFVENSIILGQDSKNYNGFKEITSTFKIEDIQSISLSYKTSILYRLKRKVRSMFKKIGL